MSGTRAEAEIAMVEPCDIYLDYAASTPKRDEVAALHRQRCARLFANPHGTGRHSSDCRRAAERAAAEILGLLEIPEEEAELLWTSGGTEAVNAGILGTERQRGGIAVAAAASAHACVLEAAQQTRRLRRLPIRSDGQIDFGRYDGAQTPPPDLVAVCHVNNETGVRQDLLRLRGWMDRACPKASLLVDALQSAGKMPIPWQEAGIDLVAAGGRKLGGPAGLGALIVRAGHPLSPLLFGGGQQGGLRPGTVDVVAALELAQALRLACREREREAARIGEINRALRAGLRSAGRKHRCRVLSPEDASPWILCAVFEGYEGAILTRLLGGRGIAVSAGSACSADTDETSHVLRAMGVSEEAARGMVRISFGPATTRQHAERFLNELEPVLKEY